MQTTPLIPGLIQQRLTHPFDAEKRSPYPGPQVPYIYYDYATRQRSRQCIPLHTAHLHTTERTPITQAFLSAFRHPCFSSFRHDCDINTLTHSPLLHILLSCGQKNDADVSLFSLFDCFSLSPACEECLNRDRDSLNADFLQSTISILCFFFSIFA